MSEPINYGKHWSEVLKELNAENANLKAEVERLKEGNDCLGQMHDKEMESSAYLCEEVNRTTAWGRGLESDLSHARVEISFLKAEVERLDTLCKQLMAQHSDISCENIMLRKAGDAMGDAIEIYRLKAEVDLWKLRSDNWQKLVQLTKAEVERLKEGNRQLTKAFEIAEGIIKRMGKAAEDAAKEGKPSV